MIDPALNPYVAAVLTDDAGEKIAIALDAWAKRNNISEAAQADLVQSFVSVIGKLVKAPKA